MAFGAVFVCAISTDNISIPVFIRVNENDGYKIPHERRSVYQKYATKDKDPLHLTTKYFLLTSW